MQLKTRAIVGNRGAAAALIGAVCRTIALGTRDVLRGAVTDGA